MPIPTNKTELLAAIESSYEKLRLELEEIPLEKRSSATLPGHAKDTMMSVKDLLSYLIGWGELVLHWQREISDDREPDFPATGFKWTDLGELAQKFYADRAAYSFSENRHKLEKTVGKIRGLVESSSNKELYESKWYKAYTMGRMIQLNTSSPYKNARTRIRKWKKEEGLI